MEHHGRELNERLSGYAGTEPNVGDVIELGVRGLDGGLPLLLKAVVRDRTKDEFRVEFLADTPDERRDLALFQKLIRAAEGYTDA